ncbi:Ig-like domain-containing protein [Clostridium tertium]|uniref:Ig-like domain-containing protein n=6 Tax=Clostridium TaxID=1485 RepID=UPI0022E535CC|nr:Ig-like domain-containing protein [Clostridium tertium]MDB1931758.1 Ig-like domain-containing protein [Clostridium tertium]
MKKLLKSRILSSFMTLTMIVGLITVPVKEVKAEKASGVVISEVYGGGGNGGSKYKNDFIELYNPTDADINIDGWKIEYAAKAGSFAGTSNFTILSGVIKGNGYYLIQEAKGAAGTDELPDPDIKDGKIAMGGSDCKVRLVDNNAQVIDLVGVGAANEAEGNATAKGMGNTLSVQRKDNDGSNNGITNGWDTNNNENDFYAQEPTPRSSTYSAVKIELTGLAIDESISLEAGESKNLTLIYTPEDTTEKVVEYISLNPEIATVDKDGKIVAVKEGETTIEVKSTIKPNIKAACKVTVSKATDKIGPTVSDLKPANGQNIGDLRRPEISATFNDESGVDIDSIKLLFDGVDVSANISKENQTIKYSVAEDLADGTHGVLVEVKDNLGNLTSQEWKFTVGEVKKNLYFGQLHSHTNISDGTGTVDDAYQYAENNAKVDFLAVTDHSNWFDNDTKASLADGSMSVAWNKGLNAADKYNKDGDFVAIYGYEMTWSGSTGGYGHINTFNTPGFETRTNSKMDLKNYYNALKTQKQSMSQLNHPGKTFGDFSDFAYYDAEIDKQVTLIEVGNGEGAIRGSGYFPSYEYYTRALDKGWHVAPTNNQDNHKGKWGNANTARTVVEASDLSRESVYDAIKERRVYATEDENLKISYEVNGNTMGSIIPQTDLLEFNVNVEDINSGDNIKKISIIGDGGKVVKSIDNINSTTKNWSFTLDKSTSSYYYVRVDQADSDIAVTSAVWVGERENFGISTVDSDTEVIIAGEEFNIGTTIYNNEATPINNIKVEYYLNNGTEAIKTETIEKVDAGSSIVAKLPHKFEKAGDYSFQVKVTATINGQVKEFKGAIEVEVLGANEVSKVVIDGAHQNQYVSGDYSGKVTTLTALMAQNNIKSVINTKPITDEVLKGASLLIMSDPQSTVKDTYGLTPQKYTEDELAAIARFVQNGGNIAITSKADYGDAKDEYGNAMQGNSVLEAIGAKIRFNDDQATDDNENGGQNYRLYFDDYNTESSWMNGIDITKKYSFYSGSTLIMPPDTTNIDILVRGHATTYGNDADKQGDNAAVGKGEVIGLAVETLSNGSKVVVSGATFFSNFEMDGLDYSNYQISEKVLKELAPAPELKVSKIADVRIDNNNDNLPDRFGETVVVEGYVTAASNVAAPGNSFFDVIYVQDETAGLTIFGVSTTAVKLGQKVRIKGKVSSYLNDAQVALKNESLGLQIIDENINLVQPIKLSTKDSMLEEKEGLLVKVEGKVIRIEGQSIFVDDGSGESRVYVEGYVRSSKNPGVDDEWKARINVGDKISAIGLASEDPEGHRLRVRDSAEIEKLQDNENVKVTGVSLDKTSAELKINESLGLKASISPADATNKDVTWATSDEKIAKVDENGKVTAVGAGKVTITVTTKDGGFKATCEVTVRNEEVPVVKVTGVSLDKILAELKINESVELKATISPADATNKEVTWTSSDEKIAKVDANGKVTAVGAGHATIIVTTKDGNFNATCEVIVKDDNGTTNPIENIVEKVENPNGKNEVVIKNPSNEIRLEIKDIESIKAGNGYFEIKNGENTILLPFSLIDKDLLKEGSSIIFEMKANEDATIMAGIKGVKKVFEFNLFVKTSDNLVKIHNFKNGVATVTLKLTDEDLKGLNKENLAVFYYNEETKTFEQMETTINGNEVTFKTSHFSKFIIAEKASNENGVTLPATGGNNPIYLIIIGLIIVGAGAFMLLNKKKKEENKLY